MNHNYEDKLIGQKTYLKGVTLYWKSFTHWTDDPSWRNHGHCEFCIRFLMFTPRFPGIVPEIHRSVYVSGRERSWVWPTGGIP